MSIMNKALAAKIAKAKQVGPDMNEAQTGGGSYTPPPAGKAVRLRLVGYYEGGTHIEKHGPFKGEKKRKVRLVWELSGGAEKQWDPVQAGDKLVPQRITQEMNYSLNERAGFYKQFLVMNEAHGGGASIMGELLGKEFIGDVKNTKSKDGKRVYADLENIRKAERENENQQMVPIIVPEPLTELKAFIIDIADAEMWDDIAIEGEWPEKKDKDGNVTVPAKSKDVLRDWIREAVDFDKMPIADYDKSTRGKPKEDKAQTAADEAAMDEALGGADNEPAAEQTAGGEPDLSMI